MTAKVWICLLACACAQHLCAQNTANVVFRNLMFGLTPGVAHDATLGDVTNFFTYYDYRNDVYPKHDVIGSNFLFDGEASGIGPDTYGSDYVLTSATYGFIEYGHAHLYFPINGDSDGNGVDDFLEDERQVNLNFIAYHTRDYPLPSTARIYNWTLMRSAGQALGTYTAVGGGITLTGTWAIATLRGTATYTRSAVNTVQLALTSGTNTYTGTATYRATNASAVFAPFNITVNTGQIFEVIVPPSASAGANGVFRSTLTVADGYPLTSWADYNYFRMEMTDTNDSNSNGVPDLVDTPRQPTVSIARSGLNVQLNWVGQPSHSYTVWTSTDLRTWSPLAGFNATDPTRTLSHTPGPAQFYRVTFP